MIGIILVYVDVLHECGECDFNSLGRWSYSKEWVQNLGRKSIHSFVRKMCYRFSLED